MKKLTLAGILGIAVCINCFAADTIQTKDNQALASYQQALQANQNHKFTTNQIRSFVYYWYGLHDVHASIKKSYALLNKNNLLIIFPNATIRNLVDYKKWYDDIGVNIKNNLHTVKELEITPISDHQYQVNVVVNWQAINKDNNFINALVTQQWLLVDGASDSHPYVREYKVIDYKEQSAE
jgi:hypothetical protein